MAEFNLKETMKSLLSQKGITMDDEELQKMATTLSSKYTDLGKRATEASKKPYESTRADVLEGAKGKAEAIAHANLVNLPNVQANAEIINKGLGVKTDNQIRRDTAHVNNRTDSHLQILDSYRDMQSDGYASKDRTVAGALANDRHKTNVMADLVRSEHAMAGRGQTMGFIGNLLGAAAMLAG